MKKAIVIIIITAMWGLFFAPAARAELVIIAIEATVDYVRDDGNYLDGQINVGDIITGTYTYESTTPDTNPSPDIGVYEHYTTPCGIRLAVGGFVFQTDPDNVRFHVSITNDAPWFDPDINNDSYTIGSSNNLALSNGTLVNGIGWQLEDYSGTVLSSDALPLTAPVLEDWETSYALGIRGGDYKNAMYIGAVVTSVEVVPEPATILLFSLCGLLLRKRQH